MLPRQEPSLQANCVSNPAYKNFLALSANGYFSIRLGKSEPTISSKMGKLRCGCYWHGDCSAPEREVGSRRKRELLRAMRLLPRLDRVRAKVGAREDLRSRA